MQFERIVPGSGVPPFEQLRTQIAAGIASGKLPAGDRLPTVRGLADTLGLAPNTVAKVYRELEHDGLVVGEGRRGTFVCSTTPTNDDAQAAATAYVETARRLGLTCEEAVVLVQRSWSGPVG